MGDRGVTASVGSGGTASAAAEARHIRVDCWVGSEGEDSDGVGAVTARVGRSHGGGTNTSAPAPSIAAAELGGGAKPVVPVAPNDDAASEGVVVVKAEAEAVGRAREMMERMRRWLPGLLRLRRLPPPLFLGPSSVQPSGVVGLERRGEGGGVRNSSRCGLGGVSRVVASA